MYILFIKLPWEGIGWPSTTTCTFCIFSSDSPVFQIENFIRKKCISNYSWGWPDLQTSLDPADCVPRSMFYVAPPWWLKMCFGATPTHGWGVRWRLAIRCFPTDYFYRNIVLSFLSAYAPSFLFIETFICPLPWVWSSHQNVGFISSTEVAKVSKLLRAREKSQIFWSREKKLNASVNYSCNQCD